MSHSEPDWGKPSRIGQKDEIEVSISAQLWVSPRLTAENRQIQGDRILDYSEPLWEVPCRSEPKARGLPKHGDAAASSMVRVVRTVPCASRRPNPEKAPRECWCSRPEIRGRGVYHQCGSVKRRRYSLRSDSPRNGRAGRRKWGQGRAFGSAPSLLGMPTSRGQPCLPHLRRRRPPCFLESVVWLRARGEAPRPRWVTPVLLRTGAQACPLDGRWRRFGPTEHPGRRPGGRGLWSLPPSARTGSSPSSWAPARGLRTLARRPGTAAAGPRPGRPGS